MEIKIDLRIVLVSVVVVALALGYIFFVARPFTKKAKVTDWAAVSTCQKSVQSTYSSLLGEADVVAPSTASGIQKEEQSADNSCVTSHTH